MINKNKFRQDCLHLKRIAESCKTYDHYMSICRMERNLRGKLIKNMTFFQIEEYLDIQSTLYLCTRIAYGIIKTK